MAAPIFPGAAPTAGQQVAASIRQSIVRGDLRDGHHLPPEASLLEEFEVSRPVLREALRILQTESLLSIQRGRRGGGRVNAPSPDVVGRHAGHLLQHQGATLADVFGARRLIEPPAAGLLATRHDNAALALLADALDAETRDVAGAHAAFHVLVVELSGSRTLALFAHMIADITTAHTAAVMGAVDHADRRYGSDLAHAAHRRLLDHVRAGNAERAHAHWSQHLDETAAAMLDESAGQTVLDVMTSTSYLAGHSG